MDKNPIAEFLRKAWRFIWEEDSLLSWAANVILAFFLIYFIVYPVLGLLFGTQFPVVAVVSGSMEHNEPFELWWTDHKDWYEKRNITREQFIEFPFKNGFNQGDIMVLWGKGPNEINVGDILVFKGGRSSPIIHRVVKKWESSQLMFQTKGDFNKDSIEGNFVSERAITADRIFGVAVFRIHYLGWIKIAFMKVIGNPYCALTNNFFPCGGG